MFILSPSTQPYKWYKFKVIMRNFLLKILSAFGNEYYNYDYYMALLIWKFQMTPNQNIVIETGFNFGLPVTDL
jgi:hypothetical protein